MKDLRKMLIHTDSDNQSIDAKSVIIVHPKDSLVKQEQYIQGESLGSILSTIFKEVRN